MECNASSWRVFTAFVVVGVAHFVSLLIAMWTSLLRARLCASIACLSLTGSGTQGLSRKSRQPVSSTCPLILIAVRSFFLILLVVPVNQRLQALSFAGSLAAARFHQEAGQVGAQLRVEAGGCVAARLGRLRAVGARPVLLGECVAALACLSVAAALSAPRRGAAGVRTLTAAGVLPSALAGRWGAATYEL